MKTNMKANAYAANCPTRQILDRVGDKWAVLILLLLRDEPLRFNALRRAIEGISQKMLSQVLKSLERDGLIRHRHRHRAGDGGIFDHAARHHAGRRRRSLARLGGTQSEGSPECATALRRAAQAGRGVSNPPPSCPASSGASSTPRPLGSSTSASGIRGCPVKPGNDM